MAKLTKKEIQTQLKNLGIHSGSDLSLYSKEYKEYSDNQNPLAYTPREYQETTGTDQQYQYSLTRKFTLTCRSLFPVIGNFFTFSRVRAYKK
ncbi:MAG: hypothetical protein H8D23_20560 [Candidatus Brocadiales bacterium]|nr:hypothetical protein [Candidatus Brocadiales bacterium]